MTTTPRMRADLPFPQAGEGVYFRFTNTDCDHLQGKFGDNWFADVVPRLNRFDTTYIRECVAIGGKKDGKSIRIKYDELDCPMIELVQTILDALFISMHGRKFEDHLDYLESVKNLEVTDDDSGNA
ncbi:MULTISPECIES: hypothetical protein [Mesorhizobium]|uniref:hypothetical protein n=1 Tax=Mesorhizobium TaxID=68287 RepID=UPI0007A93A71|nr:MULTISPECIES: hypothetical protein [Mesorhizobium]AMX93615.1 hypothetical protein A4R28_11160 [Mesorhizobium ciceri]MDF3208307.1 hypothetical protein [Mesorhizobium sp. LMG15046]MDF3229121.1 hypothetical protein [Mesorhizobium sp. DSM 30133]RUU22229.1 hypothetical protein EOC84_03720 [Mesorhizobium sp. Primo-B]RUU37862.1 hypothetical protein EOC83_16495 [Mesorhizobium sp. Primo-A]